MTRASDRLSLFIVLIGLSGAASPAFAQNWMTDARRIAMGGVGGSENLASKMVESPEGAHTTIVIPLGLFQVLNDLSIYDPSSDNFDPIRATEYTVAPLHYTYDRNGTGTGIEFIQDLLDGRLNRDINTYKGFIPTSQPVGYGLFAPNWGATIPVHRKSNGTTHSVYVGGGLYFPFRGAIQVDDQLSSILSSDTDVYIPNTRFDIQSGARFELPITITGGYRGRFKLMEGGTDRDGLYVAFNYNYLHGFWYEDVAMHLRLDTDAQGLLTFNPNAPGDPLEVLRASSRKGRGMALDFGVAAVINRIEVGFGVNGLANRIKWTEIEGTRYSLGNILNGTGDFVDNSPPTCQPPATFPDCIPSELTVHQPVEYVGSTGYHAKQWQVRGEVGFRTSDYAPDTGRLGSTWLHTGFEYRFGLFEPRAGVYYSRDKWTPAVGLGLNFGKFGFDAAAYTNSANVEHMRHPSLAFSVRIGALRPTQP